MQETAIPRCALAVGQVRGQIGVGEKYIWVGGMLRLRRYRLSTDNNLNSLREVRVRSQEFAFWELEESLNNEN